MTATALSPIALPKPPIASALTGLALCLGVAVAAGAAQEAERLWLGRAWLENVALAILLGAVVRLVWTPNAEVRRGIHFAAKTLLEVAVVLLGATMSARVLLAAGPAMLMIIAAMVVAAILASYAIGRVFRLPHRLAVLVACGNSAIAAVAPAIDADGDDVAASIALTAVLGVVTVLVLPLLWKALHLSVLQFGALAGLTVYAVPQVLAAAAPAGSAAARTWGTA